MKYVCYGLSCVPKAALVIIFGGLAIVFGVQWEDIKSEVVNAFTPLP